MSARFLTPLRVTLAEEAAGLGPFDGARWTLLSPLDYEDGEGVRYRVPAGFETDFASVPRLPLSFALTGGFAIRAAVLHDWLCRQGLPRAEADALFHEAMGATGVAPWRRWLMHLGVRLYSDAIEKQTTRPWSGDEWPNP